MSKENRLTGIYIFSLPSSISRKQLKSFLSLKGKKGGFNFNQTRSEMCMFLGDNTPALVFMEGKLSQKLFVQSSAEWSRIIPAKKGSCILNWCSHVSWTPVRLKLLWLLPGLCTIIIRCLNGKLTTLSWWLNQYFSVLLIKPADAVNNGTGQTRSGKLIESKQIWTSHNHRSWARLGWAPLDVSCEPWCRQLFLYLLQGFTDLTVVNCVKRPWLGVADGGDPLV